ncbi:cell division protein ZipA C-terminal FtsZ-binding domain-containing protein [Chitinophaga sp. GCM10012297]|uniref:Cell division protein ZipA n=1 Tax=Chitinophaga chungangae TaxID=2821488 RepID=A0ABS3YLP9_9BACT|nr:cell division protein ZipA C-terminal FtsZ-binding domain-containing protein [Chitinophaga chungangae]MBO9155004.1 hypothetical protein [Chitinophaga chungangae]
MKYLIIAICIFGLAALVYYYFRSRKPSANGYFISSYGQSQERVEALGLGRPSEDVSHLLSSVKFPSHGETAHEREYKADPGTDWIIGLELAPGKHLTKRDVQDIFDRDWRSNFSSAIYGHSPVDDQWHYANAGDSPETFDSIQVAVSVQEIFDEENPDYDPGKLERYLPELEKKTRKHPAIRSLKAGPVSEAVQKAKKLVEFHARFNHDAIIVLQSNGMFNGLKAWDALLCTGLKWGDGDLFHWNNHDSNYGHDQHFSVWTITEPGYFLPENVKNGQMNPANLVFGFSIPRSADPKLVFDAMLNAVKYCQKRLGGDLLNAEGQPFNEAAEKEKLHALVNEMVQNGLEPGSDMALRSF